jgi:phosphoribosylanthranilate isomerase
MMNTQKQIFCRKPTLEEMKALFNLGVTHIGWSLEHSHASEIELSRRIIKQARKSQVSTVILVIEQTIEDFQQVALTLSPDYLLVTAEHIGISLQEQDLPELAKQISPQTMLMMSVPVRTPGSYLEIDSIERAKRYQTYAGCLILDTLLDPKEGSLCGCTGRSNDWNICAAIVEEVSCPVMLAGGLGPHNIASAIRKVRPWGVDACTSLECPDKSKDLKACASFIHAVDMAFI